MAAEKSVEKYLREEARRLGGKAYKEVSPGNDGMPDRMVCFPVGRICFVETKSPKKKSTVIQRHRQEELASLGAVVYYEVDSREKVDALLMEMSLSYFTEQGLHVPVTAAGQRAGLERRRPAQ